MKYTELKQKHQDEFGKLDIFYAFSTDQMHKQLHKRNISKEDAHKVLCRIPSGGFIHRDNVQELKDLLNRQIKEKEEFLSDEGSLKEAILYELSNHEYRYTRDESDAVGALGLDLDNEVHRRVLDEAKEEIWREYDIQD